MKSIRTPTVAVALTLAAVTAGCGLGPGESSSGEATLTVTRDFGAEVLLEATQEDPAESETVIRFLDREAELETRYGGGFVHSIDGLSGEVSRGRSRDWFFFVNGIESPRGAADVPIRGGDRIWWDYRDWTEAMRAPAVVGSWPEPFAQVSAGADRVPVRIECRARRATCSETAERLAGEGVDVTVEGEREANPETAPALRLLVGPWGRLRGDADAVVLEGPPASSGVFARFERGDGGWRLSALDERARAVESFTSGAGLVAAVRPGEDPATWVVTGTDGRGVAEAVTMLRDESLAHRYAVLGAGGRELALPEEGAS